jgi:hypothetical protein
MAPPTNFDYEKYKKYRPLGFTDHPKLKVNMNFLHENYTQYVGRSKTSTDNGVMRHRVNDLRQMTTGIKQTAVSIKANIAKCKPKTHDKFKIVLMQYLELLRRAERNRQKWLKAELKAGNLANLEEIIYGQELEDVIRI